MAADLLEVALRNPEFAKDCMENPDVSNTAMSVVDRIITFFGDDVPKAKIEGPMAGREGFDVSWKLTVRER